MCIEGDVSFVNQLHHSTVLYVAASVILVQELLYLIF